MKKKYLIIFAILLVAFSCAKQTKNKSQSLNQIFDVQSVQIRNISQSLMAYGYIKPEKAVDIVAYTAGRIIKIWKQEGAKVKKGDKLLSIEGYYNIKSADSGLHNSSGSTIIHSPISGYFHIDKNQVGLFIKQNDKIGSVVSFPFIIDTQIFNNDISKVHKNDKVIIKINNITNNGKVLYVGKVPDSQTGGFHIGIKIIDKNTTLRPYDYVEVKILTKLHRQVLTVPAQALYKEKNKTFVVIQSNQKFKRREVQIGFSDGEYVEIKKGLSPKDKIATKFGYELFNKNIKNKIKIMD